MSTLQVTEVRETSPLVSSVKRIAGGCALLALAGGLLVLNEVRAARSAAGLAEGARQVVSVPSAAIDPANEGRLVHTSGAPRASTLEDATFGIRVDALRLARKVEMYQWKEVETRKKDAAGKTVIETDYQQAWVEGVIDSRSFKNRKLAGANPTSLPFDAASIDADDAQVGAFGLPKEMLAALTEWESVPVDGRAIGLPAAEIADRARIVDGAYYLGDPARPGTGDARVSFRAVRPAVVSVVAKQAGSGLAPFATSAGETIALVEARALDAKAMFASALRTGATITWALRGVGVAMAIAGIALLAPFARRLIGARRSRPVVVEAAAEADADAEPVLEIDEPASVAAEPAPAPLLDAASLEAARAHIEADRAWIAEERAKIVRKKVALARRIEEIKAYKAAADERKRARAAATAILQERIAALEAETVRLRQQIESERSRASSRLRPVSSRRDAMSGAR